jgi:hypothetical protein
MISPIWTTFGRKKTLFPRLCLRGAYRSRTGVPGFAAGLGGTSNEDFFAARERFPLNHACCRYRPAIPLLPGTTGAHLARTPETVSPTRSRQVRRHSPRRAARPSSQRRATTSSVHGSKPSTTRRSRSTRSW